VDLQLDGAALTAWLVDTPSVSGDEGPLADAIEAALRPLAHLTVHRDGNTIVARTTLGRPERVILAGHVDTVPVAGNLPSRVEGPRLYGCGTSDMKAGVAVQLRLAAGLTSPRRDVSRRTRTASSADEATCAWTPQRRLTTSAAGRRPTGSSRWRRIRHASACCQVTATAIR